MLTPGPPDLDLDLDDTAELQVAPPTVVIVTVVRYDENVVML